MSDFEYTPPKNAPVSTEEMQNDLKQVAEKLNTDTLTQKLYSEHGKYDVTNLSRRFGTWNRALATVGLKPGNINNYSDEELFENILSIWQHKGKQPTRRDLSINPSTISHRPIIEDLIHGHMHYNLLLNMRIKMKFKLTIIIVLSKIKQKNKRVETLR